MYFEDSPPYSASIPAPSYSREPNADEERLAFSLRTHRRSPPTGQFRKTARRITLTLNEQRRKAKVPVYEHNSLITGTVDLEDCDRVRSVVLKFGCRLELSLEGGNYQAINILSETFALWKEGFDQPCPNTHTFAIPFASVYNARGRTQQLPPSYDLWLPGGFSAKCIYTLKVRIYKKSNPLTFWTKPQRLCQVLEYKPRTCPPRPIFHAPFLPSVKSNPEEWLQSVSIMTTRPESNIAPIICNLFIPSAQIYALSDTIPFHIQLSGPIASFRALFDSTPIPPSSDDNWSTTPSCSLGLRVFLSRETSVKICGNGEKRVLDHAQAALRALPPLASHITSPGSLEESMMLDFEGEVRCTDAVTCAGFTADALVVKDYIVVAWTPNHPQSLSPFLPFRNTQYIKFTTDPWAERIEQLRQ